MTCKQSTHPYLPPSRLRPLSLLECERIACEFVGIHPQHLRGDGRHRTVVSARELTTWIAREFTLHSYVDIAVFLGRPNHSTLVTAMGRMNDDRAIWRKDRGRMYQVKFGECKEELRRQGREVLLREERPDARAVGGDAEGAEVAAACRYGR